MQKHYRYLLPAILLVLMLSGIGYSQPASSAAIRATATVIAPLGVASYLEPVDSDSSEATGLFVLCPTDAHVLVTVNERSLPTHSRPMFDTSAPGHVGDVQPAVRVLDFSHLTPSIPTNSGAVVTVIFCEN